MKLFYLLLISCLITVPVRALDVIRINQLGYLPRSVKVAVYFSDQKAVITSFQLIEAISGKVVFKGKPEPADP
jgi:hypothetical protein